MDKTEDVIQYNKDLEKRIEALQNLLDLEIVSKMKNDKKFKRAFHQLVRDISLVQRVSKLLSSHRAIAADDDIESVILSKNFMDEIIKTLDSFSSKYSDKSFSFLKDFEKE